MTSTATQDKNIASQNPNAATAPTDDIKINKKGFIETTGEVIELFPALKFRVRLENDHEIIASMAGRLRLNRITLVVGDKVKIEMSPYDLGKGRITYRH